MRKFALLAVAVSAPLFGAMLVPAADRAVVRDAATQPDPMSEVEGMPQMPPPPGEHHEWLHQLVGTWTVESEMSMGDQAFRCTGTDTVRSLGGRWVIGELKTEFPGAGPMHAVMTLGYNPETGKYQGTWVDSGTDLLWIYEGTIDRTGKILTLEAEGPNMMDPTGPRVMFRDVIEFKSANHRTLSSYAQMEGQWVQFGTANYHRAE